MEIIDQTKDIENNSWKTFYIGDIAKIVSGGTPNTNNPKNWNGHISWFTPTEVGKMKYLKSSNRKISKEGLNSSSAKILPKNTILLTTRAGIGDVGILSEEACTNQGFQSLIVNSENDYEYVYYLISTLKSTLLQYASGSTFLEISPRKLRNIEVNIPSLEEQQAIAKVLSDTDKLIWTLKKKIEKEKQIRKQLILEILKPKKTWLIKKLEDVCWFQEGPGLRDWQFTKSGIKVINVTNLKNGYLDLDKTTRYISINEYEKMYEHFTIDSGDIVMASSGNSYSKLAIVRMQDLPLLMNTSVIRFKPLNGMINYNWLLLFLKSTYFKTQIDLMITGGAQPNFGPFHLKQIQIQIPPNTIEQQRLSEILLSLDKKIENSISKLDKYLLLKQSLLQNLLTGKIRLL